MDSDDASLLAASLDDPRQFNALFERHHRVIWVYLARLAGADVADDLAGEVFATAFAQRARFDPSRGMVRSWLYGIASNRLRMTLRTERRRRQAFARVGGQRSTGADPFETIEDGLVLTDERSATVAAMNRLRSRDREILILFAWEELSYDEIAAVLNMPIGTVRSRLARARGRLNSQLNDQLSERPRSHPGRRRNEPENSHQDDHRKKVGERPLDTPKEWQ